MRQVTSMKEIETALDENEEIIVSKENGNNLVIMSIEEYKKKIIDEEIIDHLLKAEDDIENGRVKDAKEVFKAWKEKYGI